MNCGIECILNKFSDNMPEGRDAIRSSWLVWEMGLCKAQSSARPNARLCPCWGNPRHKYRLDGHVESVPEEKDLRSSVWLGNVDLQPRNPSCILGCIRRSMDSKLCCSFLCLISGSVGDQVRWSFEQPGLVEDTAPPQRVVGTRWCLRSLHSMIQRSHEQPKKKEIFLK